ncbi:MAG: hypothetical protein MZV70_33705 [Desulfobacterales bacterium]|nr:hypothetical protein [Desulfobacterales bacterium]
MLSTGNFEQSRDGWQLDIRARDQRGRVTDGTRFVETRTGDVSLYGFGWGGSGTVDQFDFNCASKDEKYRECQLPIDGRARAGLAVQVGRAASRARLSQRGDRVWVTRGRRREFRSGSRRVGRRRVRSDHRLPFAERSLPRVRDPRRLRGSPRRGLHGLRRQGFHLGQSPGTPSGSPAAARAFQPVPTSGGSGRRVWRAAMRAAAARRGPVPQPGQAPGHQRPQRCAGPPAGELLGDGRRRRVQRPAGPADLPLLPGRKSRRAVIRQRWWQRRIGRRG